MQDRQEKEIVKSLSPESIAILDRWTQDEVNDRITRQIGKRFVGTVPDNWHGLEPGQSAFLHGSTGTGKTYLAAAMLSGHGKFTAVVSADLMAKIKEAISNPERSVWGVLSGYKTSDYLLIDDLGSETPTDYALENIFMILDHRYRNDLPTVITSNLDLDALAVKLDDRIASRINSCSNCLR